MMQKREVTTEEAAEILGVGRITIQEGMKCGALEIGAAFKQTGSTTWTFIISAGKLGDFLGVSREEILKRVASMRES